MNRYEGGAPDLHLLQINNKKDFIISKNSEPCQELIKEAKGAYGRDFRPTGNVKIEKLMQKIANNPENMVTLSKQEKDTLVEFNNHVSNAKTNAQGKLNFKPDPNNPNNVLVSKENNPGLVKLLSRLNQSPVNNLSDFQQRLISDIAPSSEISCPQHYLKNMENELKNFNTQNTAETTAAVKGSSSVKTAFKNLFGMK